MGSNMNKIASSLINAMHESSKRTPSSYDTAATVSKIDGNTIWVKIPGGENDTPVQRTVDAKVGDTIKVRINNNRAYVIGNNSNPPTDDTRANSAYKYAGEASETAKIAGEAAKSAIDSANNAASEAQRAKAAADDATKQAGIAENKADEATGYANRAFDQLAMVEDVVGVITWASEHGSFVKTQDTEIEEGKVYFIYDSSSQDYMPVITPVESELANYYELTVDEAMNSFIMSHLAVTARGLWVLPNGINSGSVTPAAGETEQDARARLGSNYKVLLSNSGMIVYDGTGSVVATYGQDITFSSTRAQYIGNKNAFIAFDPTGNNGQGSLIIGGSSIRMGNFSLDEILEKTLIYDHTYQYVRDDSGKPIGADFEAFLYRGGIDVKTEYPASYFTWYLKKEDKNTGDVVEEQIEPAGYTCHVDLDECGYGAEIIGRFTLIDDADALTTDGDNLTDASGNDISVRATGDSVRVRDLTTSTTIFPTDKLMVIGSEDEHLVTIPTLATGIWDELDIHIEGEPLLRGNNNYEDIGLLSLTNSELESIFENLI